MGPQPNGDLAATKLRPPQLPDRFVDRARLAAVLDGATASAVPLVLVSAPAGSGKSTLVAAWAAAGHAPVAWLQLEELDADPARFWVSFIAAVGRVDEACAARLQPLTAAGGAAVVPALVNELSNRSQRLVVALDDFHLVDDAGVHRDVERLIDLSPTQLTVVLLTRADPPFRLGRMRLRGRVREIRAEDLRFEAPEATALLGPAADGLDPDALGALFDRTEGWAAGLVLAGLSLARTPDAARFVETFRGDDQLVAGYLADELLAVLEPNERRRMVEAAVLHRLSGPLLDAVTGSDDGAAWLDALAATNQLVIRLDTVGEWYRYHHLFRDLLLLEAKRSIPQQLAGLHRKAADWFERSGHPAAAVDHLIEAGDRERAMLLMRIVGPDLLGTGRLRTLRNVLDRLAAGGDLDAIGLLLSGWYHYLTGRYDTAQELLDRAIVALPDDVDPIRAMPLRINLALGKGDVATALAGAREVVQAGGLEALASELTTAVGTAFAWAGLADEARAVLRIALDRTAAEQRRTAHAMALVAAAVAEFHRGGARAPQAQEAARHALRYAEGRGLGAYHGVAPALAIKVAGDALEEGDRLDAAALADADRAVALARRATTRVGLVFVLTVAGDVLAQAGEDRGRDLLEEAERLAADCTDAGITRPLLDRAAVRHRLGRSRPVEATALVEALSARELAVLHYLPSQLSITEIARELYVSPNTIKTQCAAIYRKLAVSSRHAAVQAARQHRLL
ncbi:MAG: AAA family ATPase [Acidimicrobiales bacterium]|nr:AAA family ATPase [Acidimicrobiales bacterium]